MKAKDKKSLIGKFFNRKKHHFKSSNVLVSEVYVCKATFISNYDNGSDSGPQCVDFYLLTKLENYEHHELFSGKKLEMEKDCHQDGCCFKNFNTIYIEETKPLSEYLIDASLTSVDSQSLFDFIVNYNVLMHLDSLDEEEDSDD